MIRAQQPVSRVLSTAMVLALAVGCQSAATAQAGGDIQLASGGQSVYCIVEGAAPTEAESFAAAELADFIEQITGAALPVVSESEFNAGEAIYLGRTRFAAENGVDFETLGDEEWIIRAVDSDLIITGGRPRGVLYGVYEFLETSAGVRFLTAHHTHIPQTPSLAVAADLSLRDSPRFTRREIYMIVGGLGSSEEHTVFQVRRKLNSFANAAKQAGPKFGYSIEYGSPYSTHVHHRYVADFPEAFDGHPEYFALTDRGNRTYPDGQVCMSHPEVRRIFAEKLREYIERDRREIEEAGMGEPFPRVYSLAPDDGSAGKCFCERCMAIADKYGSYAGVVLEFTNSIAADIAEDYPDVRLSIGAYSYYRDLPHGIRPGENVRLGIAQLGAEFTTLPKRDTLRSMLHPLNDKARQEWEDWSELSSTMGVHDYWTPWQQSYVWPYADVHGLAETLKFYDDHGLTSFMVEDPIYGSRLHNFVDLQFYMASRLFEDPTQDPQPIIDEFMNLHYGAAAPAMTRLLEYIERRQGEEQTYLVTVPPRARAYYDPAFFIETDAMLAEAEQLVAGDPQKVADIQQERLALDETMLYLWDQLEEEAGGDWPFQREAVVARLESNYEYAYEKYGGWGDAQKRQDQARLDYLRDMPPIPPRFDGEEVIDLTGARLRLTRGEPADDPDAATGRAWRLDANTGGDTGAGSMRDHQPPPQFGLSDNKSEVKFLVRQILEGDEIPTDEQYHWHLVGRMQATPTMYFWAHHSWAFDQRLIMAYNGALEDQDLYDVYVSLKLEGPAYVPGSTSENAFSIDRIILVKVDT